MTKYTGPIEPVMLQCNHCGVQFPAEYEHECSYDKLKSDNQKLRQALEFYANEKMWTEPTISYHEDNSYKGQTYRPIVHVVREKDGLPTRVNINGQEYHAIARPESYTSTQFNNAKARRKKRREAERANRKGDTG